MRLWRLIPSCLLLFAGPEVSLACSCVLALPTEASVRNSDIVFRGKLVAHRFGRAVFSVDKQWKGHVGHRVEIDWREGNHGDCNGFWPEDLKVGNELLVFAIRAPSGVYKTSICLPTKLVGKAQTEFRDLGPGQPPLDTEW